MESCGWCFSETPLVKKYTNNFSSTTCNGVPLVLQARNYDHRRSPKNLRFPRRPKLPKVPVIEYSFDPYITKIEHKDSFTDTGVNIPNDEDEELGDGEEIEYDGGSGNSEVVWNTDEIEAISSLFRGRIPQKPGKLWRERPLPLPLPHKIRPLGLPTPKNIPRSTSRQCISKRVYKNPTFLIGLARDIRSLPEGEDVAAVLNECSQFLWKGSLSMTVRELGHMGLHERALQVYCWSQKQSHLFPDDRLLASTVEVLARASELKVPLNLDKFISLASNNVCEALGRGFIRGRSVKSAWKLLSAAKESQRMLDPGVYAKLILELGKNPDKSELVLDLLEDLAARHDLDLTQQDCTAVMKVCVRLHKFEVVEGLYDWFRKSGGHPSVVMYTTLIHGRYLERRYREAMAVVWEMEASNCLLDLPAYCVMIKLFVALNDLSRSVRYFAKLKEAGFSPTFDVYRNVIRIYAISGRAAKCKEVIREAELAGFNLDMNV